MKSKTSETERLVDQVAKTAHEMVDRIHERAAAMENVVGTRSQKSSERVVAGFERRASSVEDYIQSNPIMSAAIAFGLGICATRLMKTANEAPSETCPVDAAPSEEAGKAGIGEAA